MLGDPWQSLTHVTKCYAAAPCTYRRFAVPQTKGCLKQSPLQFTKLKCELNHVGQLAMEQIPSWFLGQLGFQFSTSCGTILVGNSKRFRRWTENWGDVIWEQARQVLSCLSECVCPACLAKSERAKNGSKDGQVRWIVELITTFGLCVTRGEQYIHVEASWSRYSMYISSNNTKLGISLKIPYAIYLRIIMYNVYVYGQVWVQAGAPKVLLWHFVIRIEGSLYPFQGSSHCYFWNGMINTNRDSIMCRSRGLNVWWICTIYTWRLPVKQVVMYVYIIRYNPYIILYYIILHYITLYYVILYYIILYFIILYYITTLLFTTHWDARPTTGGLFCHPVTGLSRKNCLVVWNMIF